MDIIEEFIKQYNKEFDFYQELARLTNDRLEENIIKRGVKAIVTFRAKRPERLRDKLLKRNKEKNYKSISEITGDIIDLAGIRVALYFPADRELVDQIINEQFTIVQKKVFPESPHNPKHGKRFSGYWATHYRVKHKENNVEKRFQDHISEIQVASVLMHAWAEVEHDLVYKPFSGELSEDELAILDEINGLVLSGEIALERLQRAIAERTKKSKGLTDNYELTSLILNSLTKEQLTKLNLGDTYLLKNYFDTVSKFDYNNFKKYLSQINIDINETISDQLLSMLFDSSLEKDKDKLQEYFKLITTKKTSGFENFLKCWIVFERALREIIRQNDLRPKSKYFVPDIEVLQNQQILSNAELFMLKDLKKVRNNLVHGIEIPSESQLKKYFNVLKKLTGKIINTIDSKTVKKSLQEELDGV
jgi:ppGpp synthetase/RelA/SpoT-type nucleotidyltranferase